MEVKQELVPSRVSSCESEHTSSNTESDSELTEDTFKKPHKPPIQRNLRNKKLKHTAIKRSRVASLNAIAKVHCLYENEARSVSDTSIAKPMKKLYAAESTDDEDDHNKASNESFKVAFATKGKLDIQKIAIKFFTSIDFSSCLFSFIKTHKSTGRYAQRQVYEALVSTGKWTA